MSFAEWLQKELDKRGWSQTDLARNAKKSGYKISRPQITLVLNGDRQASGDVCVAIAQGLNIPREEVFRARGWLLEEPEKVIPPQATPDVSKLIRDLTSLEDETQKKATQVLQFNLDAIRHFVKEQRTPYGEA